MTIASNSDLISACQNWLYGRTDIAARVPDFIALFEAKANRKLFCRQMEVRAKATLDATAQEPEFLALPTDFQTMRRIRLLNPFASQDGAIPSKPRLKFASGSQIDELRDSHAAPGAPVWFGILGTELEVLPTPDQDYDVEMVYRTKLPPLGGEDDTFQPITTNWLLDFAPDAYLYGTLMEAAPYLRDDDRIAIWNSGVTAAFNELNSLSDESTYNAGPLTMRRRRGY